MLFRDYGRWYTVQQERGAYMERLEGSISDVVYRNAENGYAVVQVLRGRTPVTVVGVMPFLRPGEQVAFEGEWMEHPTYGRQLKCVKCTPIAPTDELGIERYLSSGVIRGVGPTTARAIVQAFGKDTLTILSEHPERLQDVPGMGKKRWRQVAENFREQQGTREAMVFLQSYGIPPRLAMKISKLYGDQTANIVRSNPYRLCKDLEGVGFLTADRIGTALGIPHDSEFRISAALIYLLQDQAAVQGHVYLPMQELIQKGAALLQVEEPLCLRELQRLAIAHDLVLVGEPGAERVYLPAFDRAEREVAKRLMELLSAVPPGNDRDIADEIARFERDRGITFSENQRIAIQHALAHGVLVITGGPGTGKTTIINCIIHLLQQEGEAVMLCAPTGRAAKRMAEATGEEAKTIHRLLEYGGEDGAFSRNVDHPVDAGCLIVDECSMVDLMLMRSLLRALEPGTRLLLVGDADQLPSVGAGNVLGDLLASGVVPFCRLTDIFRQEEQSRIVVNAHRINRGEMPFLNEKGTDFFFERRDTMGDTAGAIIQLVTKRLPKYLHIHGDDQEAVSARIMKTIQVLAQTKKGECGVHVLNTMLQEALNPPHRNKPSITYGETLFRLGDKVMQTKNDYQLPWERETFAGIEEGEGIFNGDVGYVVDVDTEEHSLTIMFDEDKRAVCAAQQMENIELAYCLSVHKSQGSEFPVVVMPVAGGPPMLMTRNLFYTALTRARSLVVLVGREEVVARMVENNHTMKRYTTLAERMRETAALVFQGG